MNRTSSRKQTSASVREKCKGLKMQKARNLKGILKIPSLL
jgi:hypothetical protein